MSYLFLLFITAFLLLLVADKVSPSTPIQPNDLVGIRLGGSELCKLEILGMPDMSARVYGHKADVIKLLDKVEYGESGIKCVGPCRCTLKSPSLIGQCMFDGAQKVATTGDGTPPPPPPGTIVLIIDDGNNRPSGESFLTSYRNLKAKSKCTAELCANTKGEVSLGFTCGDIKLKVSSSGNVSMSLTSGNVSVTVP